MTWARHLAALTVLIGFGSTAAGALYAPRDVQKVPVARLVSNIERELAARPNDPALHLRLARLYAMAYAENTDELPIATLPGRKAEPEVWFGHEPNLIPYSAQPAPDAKRAAASKAYLQKSLEHYRKSLELNPEGLLARIGYGWVLEQSGHETEAIVEYRRVIERAWPKEESTKYARLGQRFYTLEAAEYLVPLLDPQRDAAEIAELRSRSSRLKRVPRPVTPVAVPLTDGATLRRIVDLEMQVPFDADGSGLRRGWTWISDEAGWLVYDAAQKGRITSALQWFGSVTFWLSWTNGYEALKALDDDDDGELKGPELRYLALWRDADRDGISDSGEVQSLAAHGIAAVSCRYTVMDGLLAAATSARGVTLRDGRVRPTYDVILRPSASVSAPPPE